MACTFSVWCLVYGIYLSFYFNVPEGLSRPQVFVANVAHNTGRGHMLRLYVVGKVAFLIAGLPTLAALELVLGILEKHGLYCSVELVEISS